MAFKTNLIRHLLGILTPEEIGELIYESAGVKKVNLTEIVSYQLKKGAYAELIEEHRKRDEEEELKEAAQDLEEENKAKILPFETKEEKEEVKVSCGQEVKNLLHEFALECAKKDKEVLGARVRKKSKKAKRSASSLFILEEKKRMENSILKLRTKEVLDLYSSSSKEEISRKKPESNESTDRESFSASKKTGVLLNKKIA